MNIENETTHEITNDNFSLTMNFDTQKLSDMFYQMILNEVRHDGDFMRSIISRMKFDTKELTREVIYAHKEEIVERVVKQAVTEVVRKGLPRFLEQMDKVTE